MTSKTLAYQRLRKQQEVTWRTFEHEARLFQELMTARGKETTLDQCYLAVLKRYRLMLDLTLVSKKGKV